MGAWCDCGPLPPTTSEIHRTELARVVIEFTKAAGKPLGPDVAPLLVSIFDVTIGPALSRGLKWSDGEQFLLRHIRQIARRATELAAQDEAVTITAFDLNAAFNEVTEKARVAEKRLKN